MASDNEVLFEQSQPLTGSSDEDTAQVSPGIDGRPSASSASTPSLVFDHLNDSALKAKEALYAKGETRKRHYYGPDEFDGIEDQLAWKRRHQPADKKARRILYVLVSVGFVGWAIAGILLLYRGSHTPLSSRPHDPHATQTLGSGKKVTLEQVLTGQWHARTHAISWIAGADGEDGLLLERGGQEGKDYLVVEDVRYRHSTEETKANSKTLMQKSSFEVGNENIVPSNAWPSPDMKKVLVQSDYQRNWRHSNIGRYWIFDVASQTGEPLDKENVQGRIQLASWSPDSDAVVFTRENNMFIRHLREDKVERITTDGGSELFYGVPDWVFEEEVFQANSATWWSGDGKFLAFLRTNESAVPEYPVQYFFSRPSGKQPLPGEEAYPEVRQIKYPKAGAPMSVVNIVFYDVENGETFTVPIVNDFADDDRLITEVVWCGRTGKAIVRETNRESDVLKVILMDADRRSGQTVRERDVMALDGGWFEVSESTTFVPSDPGNGRMHDGYIDTVIHDGYDHLAYFSPLDSSEPKMLTEGKWEVVKAPSAVDLDNNLVYYIATKEDSRQRHIYSVKMDGTDHRYVTETSDISYYDASFSTGAGFALLSYQGPGIPWQKVINTPSNTQTTEISIEENKDLRNLAEKTELPIEIYQTILVDGYELNLVERRPPHFNEKKKYPVLFFLYNGPGFQEVDRKFTVNFQSYVASSLGYIVITVDGRGTGFRGRATRCIIRGNIGYWEAHDQIAAAKMWAAKEYVDDTKMAIWGWSYGGFMTLKTLEADAGQTFKYGMAVAPVTDWRFYDSIYTERYMHTPQHNPGGYHNSSISNITALSQNVRFLVMHGVADDNVHFQNTLQLLDRLDQANVRNYDLHIFPDSDHGIFFHNANRVVYEKLSDWLVNAFNGEWLKVDSPVPSRGDEL